MKLKLQWKHREISWYLLMALVFGPFLFAFCNELLPLPRMVRYTLDVVWVALFVLMVIKRPKINQMKLPLIWAGAFIVLTGVVYLTRYQSVLYYAWGARNNFRFYFAFFAFALLLSRQDARAVLRALDVVFWVNAAVSLMQYVLWGYKGDYLGGIFGVQHGCNGYTNIFFVIITVKHLIAYMRGEEKLWHCALVCLVMLLISALAELKFYYVEFVAMLALCTLVTGITRKKLVFIAGAGVACVGAAALLVILYPEFRNSFSIAGMLEYAGSDRGYTTHGDLNRLNCISRIHQELMFTWNERLFGLGLGNCDTSSFAFLNTPFYVQHEWLHYTWMSTAFMFLENGYAGLALYFGFFLLLGALAWRRCGKTAYGQMAMVLALCCLMIGVYDSSLRMEAGYMMYFMLALPFMQSSKN